MHGISIILIIINILTGELEVAFSASAYQTSFDRSTKSLVVYGKTCTWPPLSVLMFFPLSLQKLQP